MFVILLFFSTILWALTRCSPHDYVLSKKPLCYYKVVEYLKGSGTTLACVKNPKQLLNALSFLATMSHRNVIEVWVSYDDWSMDKYGAITAFYFNSRDMAIYRCYTGSKPSKKMANHERYALCLAGPRSETVPKITPVMNFFEQQFRLSLASEESGRSTAPSPEFELSRGLVSYSDAISRQGRPLACLTTPEALQRAVSYLESANDMRITEVWVGCESYGNDRAEGVHACYLSLSEGRVYPCVYSIPEDNSSSTDSKFALYAVGSSKRSRAAISKSSRVRRTKGTSIKKNAKSKSLKAVKDSNLLTVPGEGGIGHPNYCNGCHEVGSSKGRLTQCGHELCVECVQNAERCPLCDTDLAEPIDSQ